MANIDGLIHTQVDYNQRLYSFLSGKMNPGGNRDIDYIEVLDLAISHYRSEFCGFNIFRAFHINKSTGRFNRGSSIYNTLQGQGIDLGLGSLSSVITHLSEIKQRAEARAEAVARAEAEAVARAEAEAVARAEVAAARTAAAGGGAAAGVLDGSQDSLHDGAAVGGGAAAGVLDGSQDSLHDGAAVGGGAAAGVLDGSQDSLHDGAAVGGGAAAGVLDGSQDSLHDGAAVGGGAAAGVLDGSQDSLHDGATVGGGAAAGASGEEDDSQVNDFVSQSVFYKKRLGREPASSTASKLVSEYSLDPRVAEALSLF